VTPLEVPDGAAWRAWLGENHASEKEVWLVYYKGDKSQGSFGYEESVEEALCFGWIDGLVRRIDDDRYMRRFTPRKPRSTWSTSNKERVARLLRDDRMASPGRRIVDAAQADGSWDEVPDAEKQWAMPVELQRTLDRDQEAATAFESASPAHRKQLVMWVASAKQEATRERRAEKATEMLRRGERPG